MIDDRQEELAALHALDLLEGAERDQFVAELERNAELRGRVGDLRQAAAALARLALAAEPPAALKARILASASGTASRGRAPEAARTARPKARPVPVSSWIPWLAAACLGVAAIWSGRLYLEGRSESAALREPHRPLRQS